MKIRLPKVRTSLDIASWLIIRGQSAGKEITHRKLQYLMYLVFGDYFNVDLHSKLFPSTFVLSKIGPLEPNIYHLYKKINLGEIGNPIPEKIENYLLKVWGKYEIYETDSLKKIIIDNSVWKEILLNPIGSEISENLIIKSFVSYSDIKKIEYSNIVNDDREYWTLSGKKAERWIPGLSKKNK
ncbi:MAG: hypothetical protein CFH01_00334 [Alphaproteobacteria bacterium MarineAlpha2_Bin1]|nr:MAG: hypothetical protein CFH01_00334 [Alphaproteobacteria bacterium MarineAlpha2_Bin1]|tara:strand:- start:232 stop:780 length:549 start_codon:yes stop_codon:yes gene_type:complete